MVIFEERRELPKALPISDYVIWHENDDEDDALIRQIMEVHKSL